MKCVYCGAKMPSDLSYVNRSFAIAEMDKEGLFCTLRCAARYGVAAAGSNGTAYRTKTERAAAKAKV